MHYHTGDIITAKVLTRPLLWHKAIALCLPDGIFFLHNTPNGQNDYGGNLLIDTPDDFFRTRRLTSVEHTDITEDYLLEQYEELKPLKFNLLLYNCEHFVTLVQNKKKKSIQLRVWAAVLITIILFLFLISKRKR